MPAPQSVSEFLDILQQSHLVSEELYDRLIPQLNELGPKGDTPLKVAKILCRNQVLTPYQASCLLKGQFKGFYVGKFKIMELLGRGGMGKVYLAEQISMQRMVVLKVIRNRVKRKKEAIARFIREAQAVASLRHPNIIQAYDFDEVDNNPYIVMEYIEGLNVEQQVHGFGPIQWKQAADYVLQAAHGLQHAHEANLVHRDIKPGNLIVDLKGELKLLDLGLVSCLNDDDEADQLTNKTDQLGTVDYISPEQALNSHAVDIRTDIYSLGAVFYYMVSARNLFPNKTTSQKLLLHQTAEPERIDEVVEDLPEDVASVIHKMIAKKPEDRYQSPEELIAAVEPLAERVVPPYKPEAVQFRHNAMYGYLRRSPSPSAISSYSNFGGLSSSERMNDSEPERAAAPTIAAAEQAAEYSDPNQSAQAVRNNIANNIAEMNTPRSSSRTPFVMAIAFLAVFGLGIAGSYWTGKFWPASLGDAGPQTLGASEEQKPKTDPDAVPPRTEPNPAPEADPAVKPETTEIAQDVKNAEWKKHQTRLNQDADLALHLVFDRESISAGEISNASLSGLDPNLVAVPSENATWEHGRYKGQMALHPAGNDSPSWLSIADKFVKSISVEGNFTFGMWVKPMGDDHAGDFLITYGRYMKPNWQMTFSKQRQAPMVRWLPSAEERVPDSEIPIAERPALYLTDALTPETWHFLVMTQTVTGDQQTIRIFVDGQAVREKTVNYIPEPILTEIRIGARRPGKEDDGSEPTVESFSAFDGLIDEILLYERTLSDAEIQKLYLSGMSHD